MNTTIRDTLILSGIITSIVRASNDGTLNSGSTQRICIDSLVLDNGDAYSFGGFEFDVLNCSNPYVGDRAVRGLELRNISHCVTVIGCVETRLLWRDSRRDTFTQVIYWESTKRRRPGMSHVQSWSICSVGSLTPQRG